MVNVIIPPPLEGQGFEQFFRGVRLKNSRIMRLHIADSFFLYYKPATPYLTIFSSFALLYVLHKHTYTRMHFYQVFSVIIHKDAQGFPTGPWEGSDGNSLPSLEGWPIHDLEESVLCYPMNKYFNNPQSKLNRSPLQRSIQQSLESWYSLIPRIGVWGMASNSRCLLLYIFSTLFSMAVSVSLLLIFFSLK